MDETDADRLPGVWSSNWVRNLDRMREWARLVAKMAASSPPDRRALREFRICDVADEELQDLLGSWGLNLFYLPSWLAKGGACIGALEQIPMSCRLAPIAFSEAELRTWRQCFGEADSGEEVNGGPPCDESDLAAAAQATVADIEAKMALFSNIESSGTCSSLSDYSDETSSSESGSGEASSEDSEGEESHSARESSRSPPRRRRRRR